MTSTWTPLGIDSQSNLRTAFGRSYSIASAGAVTTVTGGTGITVGGTATAPTITNAGVITVTAGTGIANGGTAQNPVLSNSGVLGVSAGTGISLGGTSQNPSVTNNGVLSVTAGTGISLGGTAQNPSVANSGVLSVTAGSGISVGGTAQNPSIAATGVSGVTAGTNISVTGTTSPTVALADNVVLNNASQSVQLSGDAQAYFASNGRLRRDPVVYSVSGTSVSGDGWLVLLNVAANSFDTSITNPAKITYTNNKITLGTQAVRASIVQFSASSTVLFTVATTAISLGQCEIWFYDPATPGGLNFAFSVLVEVMNG